MADISLPSTAKNARLFEEEVAVSNKYLDEALRENKREGLRLAVKARTIALVIIGLFLIYLVQDLSVLYYELLIAAFMLNGWAQLRVGKVEKSKMELSLLFLDLALMTVIILVPNPFSHEQWSVAMQYKYAGFPYFYIFLAGATLAYSWRTVIAVFTWTCGLWGAGYAWAVFQDDKFPELTAKIQDTLIGYPEMLLFLDPHHIAIESRVQELLIFGIVAGILALNSWRSKRLLVRQSDIARQRANLARHFAPNIVDHLAGRDQPLGDVRSQPVVVMFVDIVGFTKMAEQVSPERVVSILREFHSRMETSVFEHGGTLDKFLGDGLMVTFGTPESSDEDAKNAIRCSFAMQKSMDEWNDARVTQGEQAIRLSVGLHYGIVILGDIGSERRLEYAVLGDVVNVSSRLENLTRKLGVSIVMSDEVVEAAGGEKVAQKMGLKSHGEQHLRGREEPVNVWALDLAHT